MITKKNRGVSPVIGTVLLLALTVSIVALVANFGVEFITSYEEKPKADVDYDPADDDIIIESMGDSDTVRVRYSDDTSDNYTEIGVYSLSGPKPYQIVALKDGNGRILNTVD